MSIKIAMQEEAAPQPSPTNPPSVRKSPEAVARAEAMLLFYHTVMAALGPLVRQIEAAGGGGSLPKTQGLEAFLSRENRDLTSVLEMEMHGFCTRLARTREAAK